MYLRSVTQTECKDEARSLSIYLSLLLMHLYYEIKMTKFINSTALFTDKLLGSDFGPVFMEFLLMVCENLKTGRTMDSIAELD